MTEFNDWDARIIEEFRANEGRVGGRFGGAPLLLLHSIGARSRKERLNPMMYQAVGEAYAVFASKGGAPSHPGWYHNLVATPDTTIEVGARTIPVRARIAEGVERDIIWETQKQRYPGFAGYEASTTRQIPVVILEPIS